MTTKPETRIDLKSQSWNTALCQAEVSPKPETQLEQFCDPTHIVSVEWIRRSVLEKRTR